MIFYLNDAKVFNDPRQVYVLKAPLVYGELCRYICSGSRLVRFFYVVRLARWLSQLLALLSGFLQGREVLQDFFRTAAGS